MTKSNIDRYVTSLVNGRARLRHPMLVGLDAGSIEALRSLALATEGVLEVAVNPRVGSLLVVWDPEAVTADELKGLLEMGLAMAGFDAGEPQDEAGQPAPETAAAGAAHPAAAACDCSAKAQDLGRAVQKSVIEPAGDALGTVLDQVAKVVAPREKNLRRARRVTQNRLMLGFGAASIASLAFRTGTHAALGWVFLSFVLAHLYQHRTVL